MGYVACACNWFAGVCPLSFLAVKFVSAKKCRVVE